VVPGVLAQVAPQSPQLWTSSRMDVQVPWQHFWMPERQ
jgi:hypothetical protein